MTRNVLAEGHDCRNFCLLLDIHTHNPHMNSPGNELVSCMSCKECYVWLYQLSWYFLVFLMVLTIYTVRQSNVDVLFSFILMATEGWLAPIFNVER